MKEKRTYKRFDLIAFLAVLGCLGMLLFEGIFIFELYDRAPAEIVNLIPVQMVIPPAVEKPAPVPAQTNITPVSAEPSAPAGNEKTPVTAPVG